jgi:ATP-dependent protease HslVU (ClpYQ) ATPase subunit
MITTIQLNENVKKSLDRFRETGKETYEEIIVEMMKQIDGQKRNQRELLIEGCKEMADDNIRMTKEFELADSEIDWEWNDD